MIFCFDGVSCRCKSANKFRVRERKSEKKLNDLCATARVWRRVRKRAAQAKRVLSRLSHIEIRRTSLILQFDLSRRQRLSFVNVCVRSADLYSGRKGRGRARPNAGTCRLITAMCCISTHNTCIVNASCRGRFRTRCHLLLVKFARQVKHYGIVNSYRLCGTTFVLHTFSSQIRYSRYRQMNCKKIGPI